jgi:hypothetical protein
MDEHEVASAEITASIYSVLFANDAVSCVAFDFYQYMKKQRVFRFALKKEITKLEKERIGYDNRLSEIIKDANAFLSDVEDVMQDIITKDILKLELSISNYLKKFNVTDSDILAKAEVVRMIAGFSCANIKNQCEYLSSIKIQTDDGNIFRPQKLFGGMNLDDMFRTCENITGMLNRNVTQDIDLNKCNDIVNGFHAVCNKLSDINTISLAINTAENIADGIVKNVDEQKALDKEQEFDKKIDNLKEHFNCKGYGKNKKVTA